MTAPTANTTVQVSFRIDKATKDEASRVAEEFGLDLTTMTRAFYRQVAREHAIPLSFNSPEPNAETYAALQEAKRIIAQGGPFYATADEMFKAMGNTPEED